MYLPFRTYSCSMVKVGSCLKYGWNMFGMWLEYSKNMFNDVVFYTRIFPPGNQTFGQLWSLLLMLNEDDGDVFKHWNLTTINIGSHPRLLTGGAELRMCVRASACIQECMSVFMCLCLYMYVYMCAGVCERISSTLNIARVSTRLDWALPVWAGGTWSPEDPHMRAHAHAHAHACVLTVMASQP